MTNSDIDKATSLQELVGFEPYIREYVEKLEASLELRVFRALEDRTLTPDMALYAWMEKLSYRRLLKRYEQDIKIGQSAAQRAAPALEIQEDTRRPAYMPRRMPLPVNGGTNG